MEFFNKKEGDCDDYAIWNWYVLKHHGYKVQLIIVRTESDTLHVLVRCQKNKKVRYVNQYSIYKKIQKRWKVLRTLNKPFNNKGGGIITQ